MDNSNSRVLVDREIICSQIEGVDWGVDLWVVARSPSAVLIWKKGHTYTVNNNQNYNAGRLVALPDRTPRVRYHPTYRTVWEGEGRRFGWRSICECQSKINELFNLDGIWRLVRDAVRERKTLIIDGGGPFLQPKGMHHREWKARGGNFIVLPDGVTDSQVSRDSLGWKPLAQE